MPPVDDTPPAPDATPRGRAEPAADQLFGEFLDALTGAIGARPYHPVDAPADDAHAVVPPRGVMFAGEVATPRPLTPRPLAPAIAPSASSAAPDPIERAAELLALWGDVTAFAARHAMSPDDVLDLLRSRFASRPRDPDR